MSILVSFVGEGAYYTYTCTLAQPWLGESIHLAREVSVRSSSMSVQCAWRKEVHLHTSTSSLRHPTHVHLSPPLKILGILKILTPLRFRNPGAVFPIEHSNTSAWCRWFIYSNNGVVLYLWSNSNLHLMRAEGRVPFVQISSKHCRRMCKAWLLNSKLIGFSKL